MTVADVGALVSVKRVERTTHGGDARETVNRKTKVGSGASEQDRFSMSTGPCEVESQPDHYVIVYPARHSEREDHHTSPCLSPSHRFRPCTILGTSLTSGNSPHTSCVIRTRLRLDVVVIADFKTTTHSSWHRCHLTRLSLK